MSVKEFIPTIWNEQILRDMERKTRYVEDCTRRYEGEIKQKGNSVKILGMGDPTLKTYTGGTIDAPENLETSAITLIVDQAKYFNFAVEDVDKMQAVKGLLEEATSRTGSIIANDHDVFISKMVLDPQVTKVYSSAPTLVAGSASAGQVNVLDAIDEAVQKLHENDIVGEDLVAVLSPRAARIFRKEYITKDTDNSELLKKGIIGIYNGVTIKESNNVQRSTTSSSGDTDNIMIRTKRAIAFVNQLTKTEAYRPELAFADAVKGLDVYGGKIIFPKEIFNINVKFA